MPVSVLKKRYYNYFNAEALRSQRNTEVLRFVFIIEA